MRILVSKWCCKCFYYLDAGLRGDSKSWCSSEVNISSESLNQVIQMERKTIPFHADFKNESRK